MKINSINANFTFGKMVNIKDTKALKGLNLDDTYIRPYIGAAACNNGADCDEFILSQVPKISKLAEEAAKKNPNKSFDDLFQEAMYEIIKYTNERISNGKKVNMQQIERHAKSAIKRTPKTVVKGFGYGVDSRDLTDVVIIKDAPKKIREVVEGLTPGQDIVITERYGLDNEDPKTLNKMSKKYGISTDMLRSIEKRAEKRLRHPERASILRPIFESYKDID